MTKNETQALTNARNAHEGGAVTADPATMMSLRDMGLVGAKGGLTRKGSIAAMKAKRAAEDGAFGA